MIEVDLAIVGGGLAGTTAALRLVQQAAHTGRSIILFDAAATPPVDRTWCYWDVRGSEFDPLVGPLDLRTLVRRRWDRWGLTTRAGRAVVLDGESAPYTRIDASDFHREARIHLGAAPAVRIEDGVRIESIVEHDHDVVLSAEGRSWRCAHVIDARGPQIEGARLFQHFVGWELEFDRDVLDPGVATLMDFAVHQGGAIRFLYVLPDSPRRGLIETTVLSPEPWPIEQHERGLRDYLNDRFPRADFAVLRSEHGVLPMESRAVRPVTRPAGRVLCGGAAGGALRPSSGYAFLATQRWGQSLPGAWPAQRSGCWGALPPLRSRTLQWLDRVFLAQLRTSPEGAPELFERLFERVPAQVLARFLTDVPTRSDLLGIMRALPPGQLAWRALREAWGSSAA